MGNSQDLYKIEQIVKVFGNNFVFNDVSFTIRGGEIFGIIGSSGSGKTTLLNILAGFLKPEKGEVSFRDSRLLNSDKSKGFFPVFKNRNQLKSMYGFAFQNPSFHSNLTITENLTYFGALYDLPNESIKENAEHLLKLMNLTNCCDVLAQKLSGGMQRRLDIACSLIHDPKILILDEPTADLDPVLTEKIWDLIKTINKRGTTIIVASHDLSRLEKTCDRIIVLSEGKIAAIGNTSEIKSKNKCSTLLEVFNKLTKCDQEPKLKRSKK